VNSPNPALVSQRAVQRLPRLALLLLCAAYVLPGVFGRDAWKNADIIAVGYMRSLAQGDASWFSPSIAGLVSDNGLLPYWLGALSMQALPWLDLSIAARLPFALLLAGLLVLLWYATYHLARTEAAQPLAFAFGGEAQPTDYARAIADAALLALIASLGLLQLGHETTPELVQLAACTLFLYALAVSPYRQFKSRAATLAALPVLAASGAASTALLLGLGGVIVCLRSRFDGARNLALWIGASAVLAVGVATGLDAWAWRIEPPDKALGLLRLLIWFPWPTLPLAAWTVWRWRRHLLDRHLAIPLTSGGVALGVSLAMGGSDRALMLALPGLAVLAAFALPTLQRSVSAAIDWFSVFFFSVCALAIWVIYLAMQTGVPPKIAANVAKLAPGFVARFGPAELAAAVLGTLAWLWLVRWRTGRHRHALWKSMVLPAAGVALNWLLLMSLWLPLLDYARSYRPLIDRLSRHVPAGACVLAPQLARSQLAALEVMGRWKVERRDEHHCVWQITSVSLGSPAAELPGWRLVVRERRPADRIETLAVYRRL
jgi:4-amino-4-deoxy-L-arabinose transferase-like glycosyltransferase